MQVALIHNNNYTDHAVDCNKGGELASLHVFDLGVFSIEHEQNNVVVLCFYV